MTGKLRVAQVSAANANADISFIAHCVLSRVKGSKIDTSVKRVRQLLLTLLPLFNRPRTQMCRHRSRLTEHALSGVVTTIFMALGTWVGLEGRGANKHMSSLGLRIERERDGESVIGGRILVLRQRPI